MSRCRHFFSEKRIMLLLLGAFVAGMLTVLAPCVLPLLPVIIGGSVSGDSNNRKRPLIISISLAVSLIIFTLLLKASALLIDLDEKKIGYVSGTIVILLGLSMLFPFFYEKISSKMGFASKSQELMRKGSKQKSPVVGSIITGAALGPVFSSCSPVYAYIIATILPANFGEAMAYIVSYVIGLSLILFLVSSYSRKFISKIKWAANPRGLFQRSLAIIFIIVGLLVFTGTTKDVQTWVSRNTPFDFDGVSANLIPDKSDRKSKSGIYNVEAYDAPDFTGIDSWLNSDPLSIDDLKGKVVLVDFWTYSCINCIRTQPYLKNWYENYNDDGFEIIGVHAPEFSFEKVKKNVEKATKEAGLKYPIALDNGFATWNNYENQYWPASYLIDAKGKVRRVHFGEGGYKDTEEAIRGLIKERDNKAPDKKSNSVKENSTSNSKITPETYLGFSRAANYVGSERLTTGDEIKFKAENNLSANQWTLDGRWKIKGESITSVAGSKLTIRVSAKEVFLVMGSEVPADVKVSIDGKDISDTKSAGKDVKNSVVNVQTNQLYRLVKNSSFKESFLLELEIPQGVTLNAFTFGG